MEQGQDNLRTSVYAQFDAESTREERSALDSSRRQKKTIHWLYERTWYYYCWSTGGTRGKQPLQATSGVMKQGMHHSGGGGGEGLLYVTPSPTYCCSYEREGAAKKPQQYVRHFCGKCLDVRTSRVSGGGDPKKTKQISSPWTVGVFKDRG